MAQSNDSSFYQNYDLELIQYKQSVKFKDLKAEKEAYDIWRAEKLRGTWQGQCVTALRNFTGDARISGLARNLRTNSDEPNVGSIVKTRESRLGHLGYVLYVAPGKIYIYESNRGFDEQADTRWLNINSPLIVGYLNGGENQ